MSNLTVWQSTEPKSPFALEAWKSNETALQRLVKSIRGIESDLVWETPKQSTISAPRDRDLNPISPHAAEPGFLSRLVTAGIDEPSVEIAANIPTAMSMSSVRYTTDIETDARQLPSRTSTSVRTELDGAAPIFKVLEEWTGSVTRVNKSEGTFTAQLISAIQTRDEIGDFLIDEVSDDDHELIQEGAIFYWSVGYEIARSKQRSTVSTIRFRRLHFWKRPQMEQALERAKKLAEWFEQA